MWFRQAHLIKQSCVFINGRFISLSCGGGYMVGSDHHSLIISKRPWCMCCSFSSCFHILMISQSIIFVQRRLVAKLSNLLWNNAHLLGLALLYASQSTSLSNVSPFTIFCIEDSLWLLRKACNLWKIEYGPLTNVLFCIYSSLMCEQGSILIHNATANFNEENFR